MIWDSYNTDHFQNMSAWCYKNGDAVLFIYSLIDYKSIRSLQERFIPHKRSNNDCMEIAVGNKVDEKDRREIAKEEVEGFALRQGLECREVSAKTGQGVRQLIEEMVKKALKKRGINFKDWQINWDATFQEGIKP